MQEQEPGVMLMLSTAGGWGARNGSGNCTMMNIESIKNYVCMHAHCSKIKVICRCMTAHRLVKKI